MDWDEVEKEGGYLDLYDRCRGLGLIPLGALPSMFLSFLSQTGANSNPFASPQTLLWGLRQWYISLLYSPIY